MLTYLKKLYSVDLADYFSVGTSFRINQLLFFVSIGLAIACVMLYLKKRAISSLIKRFLRHEIFTEETAKTKAELGIKNQLFLRDVLDTGELASHVACVGRKKMTYEEFLKNAKKKKKDRAPEDDNARYYLPQENREQVRHIYERDSSSPVRLVLSLILLFAGFFALEALMPTILSFASGISF